MAILCNLQAKEVPNIGYRKRMRTVLERRWAV